MVILVYHWFEARLEFLVSHRSYKYTNLKTNVIVLKLLQLISVWSGFCLLQHAGARGFFFIETLNLLNSFIHHSGRFVILFGGGSGCNLTEFA